MFSYKTKGVCSQQINLDVENDVINSVEFVKGCPGNLFGIAMLVKGMKVDEAIEKLKGIKCGMKDTSCPDQLALALIDYKAGN
ncbi:MAG: TIGR03905 family TSCPD domain-containing protein [Clostridium sp.]